MPIGVKSADYPDVLASLRKLTNLRGALITMPHKVTTVDLVDEATPTARIAGACNAILLENGTFYGDTPEFVDFEYVANVTRVNMISLASLALAPARPKNVGIVTARLTNDTDLKWDASVDADLVGYEVVWRDTTSAVWTNSVFVGNALTYTAKAMSKDNYFFGVRAVDKDGNKSPVVYPRPVR